MYPTLFTTPGVKAFAEAVDTERQAQLRKWGEQHHPDGTGLPYYVEAAKAARHNCQYAADSAKGTRWALILLEEVYEALAESDPALLRAELVQSAAVIAAWISDIDSRHAPATGLPPATHCTKHTGADRQMYGCSGPDPSA